MKILESTIVWSLLWTFGGTTRVGWLTPSMRSEQYVGEDIQIVCRLNELHNKLNGRNSSSLSFSVNNTRLTENVKILNNTSIEFTIKNATYKRERIVCFLEPDTAVDFVYIAVGHKQKVLNFKCLSPNWQSLICTFQQKDNYIRPKYELKYSYKSEPKRIFTCNLTYLNSTYMCQVNGRHYWPIEPEIIFMLRQSLVDSNDSFIEKFNVSLFATVVPGPPSITKFNKNQTSVEIEYEIPKQLEFFNTSNKYDLILRVEISSEVNKQWQLHPETSFKIKGTAQRTHVTGLLPHLSYSIRLKLRSAAAADTEEMWSKFDEIHFQTLSAIPEHLPQTDPGSFNILNQQISVFWKELPREFHFGENYATVVEMHKWFNEEFSQIVNAATFSGTMAQFNISNENINHDLEFRIYAKNEMGASENFTKLVVPRQSKRTQVPRRLKKTFDNNSYKLTWDGTSNVTDYTVFWCRAEEGSHKTCYNSINFTHVKSSNFSLDSNDTINFAVSANFNKNSSGMIWAKCRTRPNNEIEPPFDLHAIEHPTSIALIWSLECPDELIVSKYEVKYCLVVNSEIKSDECVSVMIGNLTNNQYNLENLEFNTEYEITMKSYSNSDISSSYSKPTRGKTNNWRLFLVLGLLAIATTLIFMAWFTKLVYKRICKIIWKHWGSPPEPELPPGLTDITELKPFLSSKSEVEINERDQTCDSDNISNQIKPPDKEDPVSKALALGGYININTLANVRVNSQAITTNDEL